MSTPVRFGMVVGEKSGDILGADLMTALREIYPDAEFVGIGGPGMLALGFQSLAPMERLSVMGFVEPLGRLPELLRIKRRLEQTFIENPPTAFIGIDSPDFNLRIEKNLRAAGIPTVHYVSPSVWAYRARRIYKIKAATDLMLTLFPFETDIYHRHDIRVACVGHPLADQIGFEDRRGPSREGFGLDQQDRVITLMPGSRGSEIKRLGPVFLATAMELLKRLPALKFLIPCSGAEARSLIRSLPQSARIIGNDQFRLVDDSRHAISAADLVLMSSGTATLEAMLLRRPMIVCYKLAPITYAIASRIVNVPFFALPNLLAGKELVPEYLQGQVQVATLRDDILRMLDESGPDQAMLAEFEQMHRHLRRGASATAAREIADLIGSA